MRNGIYRLWMKGSAGNYLGAVVLKDGDVFAVGRRFAYNGHYQELAGRLKADITCTRLSDGESVPIFPDRKTFQMKLAGGSGSEFAQLEAFIDGAAKPAATIECAFLCEA